MCRLLGYVVPASRDAHRAGGRVGATVAEVLDAEQLDAFSTLARVHRDGWGTARTPAVGVTPTVRTAPTSAADDPDFLDQVKAVPARAALVHLRWASKGLPVCPENTHPFLGDGIGFAHNGSFSPVATAEALLTPGLRHGLVGTTDSERYGALVRRHRRAGADLPTATLRAARTLREVYPRASLNALALDGTHLVAVHASASARLSEPDAAVCAAGGLPDVHQTDYGSLRWSRLEDGTVLVGSTGFDGGAWEPLPAESVTSVRLSDGAATTTAMRGR